MKLEGPLRWELEATDGGTQLALSLRLPSGEDIANACAGFDADLEMLAAALKGVPIRRPGPRLSNIDMTANRFLAA